LESQIHKCHCGRGGARAFPTLKVVPALDLLPKQTDGFNCGIGVVAEIAVILHNQSNNKKYLLSLLQSKQQ
jgi:hypothetical protein